MARGKKKESLTPEERLQAALVPESEQPYKVPENWCWVKLSSLSQVISKGTTPKGGKSAYSDHGVKFLRVENINDDGTISHENIAYVSEEVHCTFLKRSILEENDILVSIAGTLGKTGIVRSVDLPMNTNQAVAFVRIALDKINRRYIKNAIDNPVIQNLLLGKTKVTSIPNLTLEIIGECPIPLPPFAEQQRIVDRIESLFAKLDEAKQKAQDALGSFETRKAAILHKAFTGELTAQWRKEHCVGMESWQTKKYSEICNIVRGGSPRPAGSPEFYGGNIPFMKVADITRNTGPYVNSTEYTIKEAGLKKTRMVDENTLLLTNSGATLGVPAICTFKTTFNDGIAAFLGLNPDTLLFHYYFWTSKTADLRAINKGAAQPNLNTDIIGNVEISLPRENEQREIVRILDVLLAKEQQAKESAEEVLEQIDLIKKAILARAFRGKLGTNDPAEESAVELVKKVLKKNSSCAACLPARHPTKSKINQK